MDDERKQFFKKQATEILFWFAVTVAVAVVISILAEERTPTRNVNPAPAPKPNGKGGKQVPVVDVLEVPEVPA